MGEMGAVALSVKKENKEEVQWKEKWLEALVAEEMCTKMGRDEPRESMGVQKSNEENDGPGGQEVIGAQKSGGKGERGPETQRNRVKEGSDGLVKKEYKKEF
jgi:hypothetical protein